MIAKYLFSYSYIVVCDFEQLRLLSEQERERERASRRCNDCKTSDVKYAILLFH